MIKVNEYFEGKVKSLAYNSPEGKSTIGVIDKGEYEFETSTHETMIIIEGSLAVLMAGEKEWVLYQKGQSFEVPANSSFKVKTSDQASYLCKYK